MNKLIKYWLSPKIPDYYLIISKTGNGLCNDIKNIILFYIIHPIKRRIAKYYCYILQKFFNLKVIAITGSSGKSTTKEMLASILKQDGKTVFSYANIDPLYNIPTTILKCNFSTKYLVLEMGVEYPGEMDFYLWITKPDIGVITSINPTHLEFFKNINGVFKEKIKLAEYLIKNNKKVILNSGSSYLTKYGSGKKNIIYYGDNSLIKSNNVYSKNNSTFFNIHFNKDQIDFKLNVLGQVNVENSLAAFATAYELGVDLDKIKKGLEVYKPLAHRLSILKIKNAIIIDDSYNNNPLAAKNSLDFLTEYSKNRKMAVVFGDMLELGEYSYKYHKEIGIILSKLPLERLVCVGTESKVIFDTAHKNLGSKKTFWVSKENEVDKYLTDLLDTNCIILIKASRSIGLDKLVDRLSK